MPAQKKPAERRQRRNQTDVGLVAIDGGPEPAPEATAKWLAVTKERWEAYWRSAIARIVDRESDEPAIRRLFHYYDDVERAERSVRKQRLVKGSTGQPVLNPAAKQISSLEPLIRQLEDRFGLTPKARLALGVSFGGDGPSLDDLNAALDADEPTEADSEEDPRLQVIEGGAAKKPARRKRASS